MGHKHASPKRPFRQIIEVRDWIAFDHLTNNVKAINNKKLELMLTRCVKAYSRFCSQTVSLSPAISSQFILGVCAAAEDRKNQ